MNIDDVNWNNPRAKLTEQGNFTVKEALWLQMWQVYHKPTREEKEHILKMAVAMEGVREILGCRIWVHSWIRPGKLCCPGHKNHGMNYNVFVGSHARKSAHLFGRGVDFHGEAFIGSALCAKAREKLEPHLKRLGLRMEDRAGNWVHVDTMPVGRNRFFKP